MKGLIVFNEQNRVSFFTFDKEFEKYVRLKFVEADHQQDADCCDLEEVLLVFFLPFVHSVTVFESLKKPLISITGEDDLLIVFKQFDNHLFIAVNGDGTETEEMMMRKLHVLNRILGLLYGPVTQRMMPSEIQQRHMEWQRLDSLLKSYEKLYSEEHSFLVESIEHTYCGQKVQKACGSLTEECLLLEKNGGLTGVHHALLLKGTKILAVFGHSPQLPTADTLLIILIVANRFYHNHHFLFSQHTVTSDTDDLLSDSSSEYFSCEFFLSEDRSGGEIRVAGKSEAHSDYSNDLSKKMDTTCEDGTKDTSAKDTSAKDTSAKDTSVKDSSVKDTSAKDTSTKDTSEDMNKYFEQKVFLQLRKDKFIPHVLHCIEVYPKIVLVLVSERIGSDLAGLICQSLTKLRETFDSRQLASVSIQVMFDMLDDSIRSIIERGKVEAWNMKSLSVVQRVSDTWNRLQRYVAVEMLNLLPITDDHQMGRVITEGKNLIVNLKALFEELYFSPRLHGAFLSVNFTKAIAEMIQTLVHILSPGKSELDCGRELFTTLDDSVSTIVSIGNVEAKRLKNVELKQNIVKVFQIWGRLKEYGSMMATSHTDDLRLTKVVNEGRNLLHHLKSFFREQQYDVKLVVPQLLRLTSQLIGNYSDNLIEHPVSPATKIPGMVHFLFVNRSDHTMLKAPSSLGMLNSAYVELLARKHGKRPDDFLREKVQAMVLRAQIYLNLGYHSHTWLDTEFHYGYFLMLLDPDAYHISSPQLILKSETQLPGVLSGDYYSDYDTSLKNTMEVCEMYCIFKPGISLETITNTCKTLTLQLMMLSKTETVQL